MASKDRFQKRARAMQEKTGWSYGECLHLARSEISEEGFAALVKLRNGKRVPS